jgi:gamma-resorcylate decarboxylase
MKVRHQYAAKKWIGDYFRSNFILTTSGNFSRSALDQAIAEIGVKRVLWSADYPFEAVGDAANWIDAVSMTDENRSKIVRGNAEKLLKLVL